MNSSTSTRPGSAMKLNLTTPSMRPIATPAARAVLKEVNRAISAAVSARRSDPAPRSLRVPADPSMPPMRIIATVATPPPRAHTNVEIDFGLTPRRRARSGFTAAARMVRPISVRLRNQPRPSATSGTTTTTATSAGLIRRSPMKNSRLKGNGYPARALSMSGNASRMAALSWLTPMVATSRITRGAVNSRRTTASSMTAP